MIAAMKFAAVACLVSAMVVSSNTWETLMASVTFFPPLTALIMML